MTSHDPDEAGGPSAALAAFAADLAYEDLPEPAVRLAERCFLDTVGVALAGSTAPPGFAAAGALSRATGVADDASVFGRDRVAPPPEAAFVNATAAHALDFDDTTPGQAGHLSGAMVPAVLAVAETRGASGREAIAAYVAGYETASRVAKLVNPVHYAAGWHSTGTVGTFAAAAAVARLLDLDPGETHVALSVAASMPAGLRRQFGTDTKPMHAGGAARAGVTAARLAEHGFTADPNALAGDGGFVDLYTGGDPPDAPDLGLGDRWAFVEDGVNVKKYPCGHLMHTAIAATAELRAAHDLDPDDVVAATVTVTDRIREVLRHPIPDTGLEAKFSLPYAVAGTLVHGEPGLSAFEDEAVADPAVRALLDEVSLESDPALPDGSYRATVTIETTDGATHTATREDPPGTHDDPLTDAELSAKFADCAERVLPEGAAADAYDAFDRLRDRDEVAALVALLQP